MAGCGQEARHRGHVRAVCDEQAGVGVPQGVDVQVLRQAVLFQDQLEPPGESGGRHGKAAALAAEQRVSARQLSAIIGLRLPCALLAVFSQQELQLQREVDIPVSGESFGSLGEDLLVRYLHRIPADVDRALFPADVTPLQDPALVTAAAGIQRADGIAYSQDFLCQDVQKPFSAVWVEMHRIDR